MDARRVEFQIRVVRVTYRAQAPILPPNVLQRFRERALALLDGLEGETMPEHLRTELADVRREVRGDA